MAHETFQGRHAGTRRLLRYFRTDHLPPTLAARVAPVGAFAHQMAQAFTDSAELTVALRKLLETQDAFLRAAVAEEVDADEVPPPTPGRED